MTIKRRALSILLSLAVIFTFMPFVSTQAYAASSKKVQLIKQVKNNKGDTVKYTYNKKGLVAKVVSKKSYKGSNYDETKTKTTKYTYTKKNRIKTETTTDVTKRTDYKTDYTTGKQIVAKEGTVTTTDKYVTKYTYNKKGRATKSVTTKTTTKKGSLAETNNKRDFFNNYNYEMQDGKLVYRWRTDASGNKVPIYFTGAVDQAVGDWTTVTTYSDNGNGTYRETTDTSWKNSNFTIEPVYEGGVLVAENVVITNTNKDFGSSTNYVDNQEKTVTTTTYKYDKKKRVKSAVETIVETSGTTTTEDNSAETNTYYYSDGSSETNKTTNGTINTDVTTTTEVNNISYTYNKKGKVNKKVTKNSGVSNIVRVETYGLPNYTTEWSESDGSSGGYTETASGADYARVVTTTTANGTQTITEEQKAYTWVDTYKDGHTESGTTTASTKTDTDTVKAYPTKETVKYAYDKKGNMKSAKYTLNDINYMDVYNETYGNLIYAGLNKLKNPETAKVVVNHTEKYTEKYENTIKKGSKRLAKQLKMTASRKYDRVTTPGYALDGRTVYTIKAKKLSSKNAKAAELQQWIIQNGGLNGVVGL